MSTTLPAPLKAHVHVSERESDGSWEDCTWCATVMLARIAFDASIPATLREAEALRAAAGKPPTGGSSTSDAVRGVTRRYGWTDFQVVEGFDALWEALQPGWAAAAQGKMGAFPAGHSLRRWDPGFTGGHDVLVARADDEPHVWWDDPLAPTGSYKGQWVSKDNLERYVRAFGGTHLVARYIKEATVDFATISDQTPKLIDVLPGAQLVELDGTTVIRTLTGSYPDQFSPYAAGGLRVWVATVGGVARPVLVKGAKNIRSIVDNSPFTKAQLDAAVSAAVAQANQQHRDQLALNLGNALVKLLSL